MLFCTWAGNGARGRDRAPTAPRPCLRHEGRGRQRSRSQRSWRLLRQRDALAWPSTRNTAARASIASSCHRPRHRLRAAAKRPAPTRPWAATDRKRSPPRSSTPTTLNGGSGHFGLGRLAVAGAAAAGPFLHAGFDVAHARLQRLASRSAWALAWACSTCARRSSSACRAASKSGWVTGLGWRLQAAAWPVVRVRRRAG